MIPMPVASTATTMKVGTRARLPWPGTRSHAFVVMQRASVMRLSSFAFP